MAIIKYDPEKGIQTTWEDGSEIFVKYNNEEVTLSANKAGLISLANHLLTLAQSDVPSGSHVHYDENNSLEQNSVNLIIEKN